MAIETRTITTYYVTCDRCDGRAERAFSAKEARLHAEVAGWALEERFNGLACHRR